MKIIQVFSLLYFSILFAGFAQNSTQYIAGFKTMHLIDSTRLYKPNTLHNNKLHYRPLDIDIWYPSEIKNSQELLFEDLFRLHEERANFYQDETDYSGFSEELIAYIAAGFGLDAKDGNRLLKVKTGSYLEVDLANGKFPLIIYMASYNGMGWESYRILEKLAENGFVVISISSIGRYPGDMTNDFRDTMEQVNDAEFTLEFIKKEKTLNIEFSKIGILGLSWGGMSGIILLDKHPEFKAMVSLDGTDSFYYGDTDEDDAFLNEIYNEDIIHPENTKAAFLHIEAGDRFEEFTPTDSYLYYDKVSSSSDYLRFTSTKHEDFGSIAWALKSSEASVRNYEEIMKSSLLFFEKYFSGKSNYDDFYKKLITKDDVENIPYDYQKESVKEIALIGVIQDKQDRSTLSYVNIGLLNSDLGTVSDKTGEFKIKIPLSQNVDSLRFSRIGYKPVIVAVKDLNSNKEQHQIFLEEDVSELSEVILRAKTWKRKKLGNQTKSNFIGHLFYYEQLGKEMGIKLNVNKKPNFVEAFHFHVSYNRFSAKSFFRLNIYTIENGKPAENILRHNIIIPVDAKQTGMISTNLEAYDIVLTEDVIVSLEWVDNEGEVKPTEALVISVGLFTGGVYERNSKEAKMRKKLKGMGLGFAMDVRY